MQSQVITRDDAVKNLKLYVGKDIYQFAAQFNIKPFVNGKQNKGWKGLVLERLAGLTNNSKKAPNGESWELKSVAFKQKGLLYVPKETMFINTLTPAEVIRDTFFESHCWAKLKSLVVCAMEWKGTNVAESRLLNVTSLDFVNDSELIREIESDYEFIREKLKKQGFKELTGRDGKWLQNRTKGPGHGSISRAFYMRTSFVTKIFEESGI